MEHCEPEPHGFTLSATKAEQDLAPQDVLTLEFQLVAIRVLWIKRGSGVERKLSPGREKIEVSGQLPTM